MKIVFMGTPDFASSALEKLIEEGYEIGLAVSMPDKPKGRGYELVPTPVKAMALSHGIKVLQPLKMNDESFLSELRKENADVFVVAAYGKLLSKEILDMPRLACINIHASLLPQYRGAAPIQWALIDGMEKTGITTMLMDKGLDTGDILKKYELSIDANETGGGLFDKLARLGREAIVDTLENLDEYMEKRTKQGEASTDYAAMLSKKDGELDFKKPAVQTERLVRALNPWPSAFTYLDKKTFKIWEAGAVSGEVYERLVQKEDKENFGKLIQDKEKLYVICKESLLELKTVQLEGKKRMDVPSFLRGYKIENDISLGR